MKSLWLVSLLYPGAAIRSLHPVRALAVLVLLLRLSLHGEGNDEEFFRSSIQPLLKEYCLTCHSTEKLKGDLDLELFSTLDAVKRHPKIWQNVVEQLATDEMPPKKEVQPSPEEKERLSRWVVAMLNDLALARDGDPGPVVLRRLSNAEYTYTVRDLTGIESLAPAREFPADGAAGEGFTNTGQALVMSPALVTKYLEAGKEIAKHAVLLPNGIRFSSKNTRRDWTDEIVREIRTFYWGFAEKRENERVNVDGVLIETNDKGFLPVERYLIATLLEREALVSGRKNIAGAAREHRVNAKYFGTLVSALSSSEPSLLLDLLRHRWRTAMPTDAAALSTKIAQWQKALWKLNKVGHIGTIGGPKAWMEPVNPITAKQEVRFKIPTPTDGKDVTLFLVASDAGDGNEHDSVVWEQPRLVARGRPDLLLRDIPGVMPGLDPIIFERHPHGNLVDPASFCVRAPSIIEIRLPPDLAAGCELVTTGVLEKTHGAEGNVQLQVLTDRPERHLMVKTSPNTPFVVNDGSIARRRIESAFDTFRKLFPAALCYTQIVPVDEGVTLRLFHRDDEHLLRLMLDDSQRANLDRLWDELHYVSHDALTIVDALEQLSEYATSVGEFKFLDPLREPIKQRAAAFRQRLRDTEPNHLEALLEFAGRAYRRPLADSEKDELRGLYTRLREQELPHEESIRLALARVLVGPAFLYRAEKPGPGAEQIPVDDWELASRLSYFLWSSTPDPELSAVAASGKLREPATLRVQMRRMLRDRRVRRLAIEFACQWLQIRDIETLEEKSERHFPTFASVRSVIAEEPVVFFTDLFQRDGSVLEILDADHTFLNEALAKHYGIPAVTGETWRRVDGVRKFARGGILAQAATLAKQSGASRTSPILRGNWVAETLLGDKLPRPPKDVPVLPEGEATETLTMRELTEKHTADERCYGCHKRIDAFGFALESFDAIGRHLDRDSAGRPIDTRAIVMDGTEIEGLTGLRNYLVHQRRDVFLRQFCRKLLGYALGRSIQLSDEPLLTEMRANLTAQGYRVSVAVDTIVQSRQFLEIRGREASYAD